MRSKTENNNVQKIAVDVKSLAEMLCTGTQTADKIGADAGAVVRIGKRKLFIVKKVQEYLETITEV